MNRTQPRHSVTNDARRPQPSIKEKKKILAFWQSSKSKEKRVIFSLLAYETINGQRGGKTQELQAGNTYEIVITAREDANGEKVEEEDLRIRITPSVTLPSERQLPLQDVCFKYAEIEGREKVVPLEILGPYPDCTLELSICPGKEGHQPFANTTVLKVQGTYEPKNTDWFKADNLSIDPPEHVVTLFISQETGQETEQARQKTKTCKIRSWSYYKKPLEDEITIPADFDTVLMLRISADGAPTLRATNDILANIHNFSDLFPQKTKGWLSDLFNRYPNQLCFALIDDTTLEIPWEMVKITEKPLGVEAQIVRWLPPRKEVLKDLPLYWMQETHQGPILAYMKNGTDERQELEKYMLYDDTDVDNWLTRLDSFHEEIGLIYASGFIASRSKISQLDSIPGVGILEARRLDIRRRERSHVTIFINASDSARHTSDEAYISFVERLLLPWKSCYIGVLANIDQEISLEVVKYLVEPPEQDRNLPIAKRLWQLRQKAFADLEDAKKHNMAKVPYFKKRLVHISLYLYYGNPQTVLRLQEKDASRC